MIEQGTVSVSDLLKSITEKSDSPRVFVIKSSLATLGQDLMFFFNKEAIVKKYLDDMSIEELALEIKQSSGFWTDTPLLLCEEMNVSEESISKFSNTTSIVNIVTNKWEGK